MNSAAASIGNTSVVTAQEAALLYAASGLSVLPIRADGTKAPAIHEWKSYETRRMTRKEILRAFRPGLGVGIICGKISGGLVVIDFEEAAVLEDWQKIVEGVRPELLVRLPLIRTPSGGCHVFIRAAVAGSGEKLARSVDKQRGHEGLLIETRGEGQYVITVGSPGTCHPSGREYVHAGGPPIVEVPSITIAVLTAQDARIQVGEAGRERAPGRGWRPRRWRQPKNPASSPRSRPGHA